MSIVERLFPAAELEALRGSIEGFTDSPPRKRRKTDAEHPLRTKRLGSTDSGYDSEQQETSSPSSAASPHTADQPTHPRPTHIRSYTTSSTEPFIKHALVQKYLRSMHPLDRARYYAWCRHNNRTPVTTAMPSPSSRRLHPDLTQTLLPPPSNSFQLAPRRNTAPCPTIIESGRGWTAGPKAAATSQISMRLFDGVRLTTSERSMLDSLLPSASTSQAEEESEAPKIFEGFAISAYDEEDMNGDDTDLGALGDDGRQRGPAQVEDFFDLDEASEETGTP